MKISFSKPSLPKKDSLALGLPQGAEPTPLLKEIDEAAGGAIGRAMKAGRFEGRKDQTLVILAPPSSELTRLVLVGLGKPEDLDELAWEGFGGTATAALLAGTDSSATIAVEEVDGAPVKLGVAAARVAHGATLRSYRFDKYRTKEKPEDKPALKRLTILTPSPGPARKAHEILEPVAQGVFLTRDLVTEPANVINPKSFAERMLALQELGVSVEVLGEKQMRKLGMGALLGVGQGSANESQLVVLEWRGAKDKKSAPIAFVGKGVTFDTGGISIKPAAGMEDMKWDMGGAGTVAGLMTALAGRKARVNAVGILGLVENMPSGTAQRPGDVVTSASGQTIEVLNTDAEGRLVLADALWYVQDRFKPKTIIDLATLTGAIIVSLGSEYAGLFSNDDDLAEALTRAGKSVGEKVWRLPLGEPYDQQLKSDIADMKNIGGREAGSITAAQFLKRFVNEGMPWAHLDIAGTTWSKKDSPIVPKGGTAFGVRLLDRLVADRYEG